MELKKSAVNARAIALRILLIWERKKTPLDEIIGETLNKYPLLEERDKALVTNLVNGVVRHLGYLDYLINRFSRISISRIDSEVRNALRLGIFQLLFTRIPDRVALAETLKVLLQRGRAKWVRGFVNAILHRVSAIKNSLPEPPKSSPMLYLAVKYSFPEWLLHKWSKRWSLEELEKLLQIMQEIPALHLRTNITKISRERLLEYLREEGLIIAETCPYSPVGIVLKNFKGKISELKAFKEGLFSVQDCASQLVTFLLQPQPGEVILDACAGVGGKTTHIAELTGNKAIIYAIDQYASRLNLLRENFQRLNLTLPQIYVGNVLEILTQLKVQAFDRILLDVPCSGTGIIRRHPDIKWVRSVRDVRELSQKQLDLLKGIAPYLKIGGTLVYATCSLESEENEEVISHFLAQNPNFRLVELKAILSNFLSEQVETLIENRYYLKTYPHRHNLDGFFAVRLERTA
ncbi:MAG: 16S rRNA (cytosine(967)-C(5))-methyltransferase RsmB [Caldimicrobium sp.]|nr:16S rRNA (cytosine(967)-C(5))-methyltransferase RsmB [Caldimicrobium sp.]MCX7873475.1 16S rRNA (cytosine(967)-C(5))-methyltransferase RsmB [Caldimicrobium sp.]MDW8094938.1 16S rRNA (cytosine(967)-C(5))-methyltransferase RsmB [Caldimicrobium sp.]